MATTVNEPPCVIEGTVSESDRISGPEPASIAPASLPPELEPLLPLALEPLPELDPLLELEPLPELELLLELEPA
jgi:hypothetical protein